MDFLDLKGKTCPVPVIETKNLVENRNVTELTVVVDNPVSCENVSRFLTSRGFDIKTEEKDCTFQIMATRRLEQTSQTLEEHKVFIYIDGETLGRGSDELGRVLMRSFLYTTKELATHPWRIVFLNSGVKLVAEGSEYLDILHDLEGLGTEILACGTCLDYFDLKDKVRAGRISNMYEIESSFLEATKVIQP